MILAFTLSMPGAASWNGRWSGEGRLYVKVQTMSTKALKAKAESLIGHHSYGWSDGWRASVAVREVDAKEARQLRRKSNGFCGYDWMVGSLLKHGKIIAPSDEPQGATNLPS